MQNRQESMVAAVPGSMTVLDANWLPSTKSSTHTVQLNMIHVIHFSFPPSHMQTGGCLKYRQYVRICSINELQIYYFNWEIKHWCKLNYHCAFVFTTTLRTFETLHYYYGATPPTYCLIYDLDLWFMCMWYLYWFHKPYLKFAIPD